MGYKTVLVIYVEYSAPSSVELDPYPAHLAQRDWRGRDVLFDSKIYRSGATQTRSRYCQLLAQYYRAVLLLAHLPRGDRRARRS